MSIPILFVDHAPALAGAEQSLLLLFKHLERPWQPHLACAGGPLAAAATALNVPVHVVDMPRLRRSPTFLLDWIDTARAIATITRRVGARLLHANTVRGAVYTVLAARLSRRPFVWHMRDYWLSESEPGRLWADRLGKQLLCAGAHAVITNSYTVAAHLHCPRRVTVIHNGLETGQFNPCQDGAPFRRQYGLPLDVPIVGMISRLRPWKGQATFMEAAALLHQARPEIRFLIVGGDPFQVRDGYAQHLRYLVSDLGLEGRVTFTGHLADVRPALAAIDIFVHPGAPEPFGLVNVEAMAMGKPVVGFAHGALPEIVIDGQTGLLAAPGNVNRLAQAITTLLDHPEKAQAMGQAGRARVAAKFDVRNTANLVSQLYKDLT